MLRSKVKDIKNNKFTSKKIAQQRAVTSEQHPTFMSLTAFYQYYYQMTKSVFTLLSFTGVFAHTKKQYNTKD